MTSGRDISTRADVLERATHAPGCADTARERETDGRPPSLVRPWTRLRRWSLDRARRGAAVTLVGMLVFSGYGTLLPGDLRCALPGSVGCPGGFFGAPLPGANASLTQWFNVTMYDYGFWIINTVDGSNETGTWTVYEGWTVHINATSLKADASSGGTAYHGLGVEINATGKELLSLAAPVGKWVTGTFVAPTHAYYRQHIWCTVYCGDGHSGQYRYILNIVPSTAIPSVTVSASPRSGTAPLTVALSATIQGGTAPFTTSWNFGDGTPASSTVNLSHTYSLSGTYEARFTVVDSASFQASGAVSITVSSAAPLAATATIAPLGGVAPLETDLNASATGGAGPYTFSWSMGDGSTVPGAVASHLYTAPGLYALVLTVSDSAGSTTSWSGSVTVESSAGSFPLAASASPASGTVPLAVTFGVTTMGGLGPFSYLWLFGDGASARGPSPTHTFSVNGLYEATVFGLDSSGRVGSNSTPVYVTGSSGVGLRAFLAENPATGSPPLSVNASVSIEGGTEPYQSPTWTFGDGTSATGSVVAHRYTRLGSFNMTVQVTDGLGATASATTLVRVAGLLITVSLNRSVGDAPFSVGAGASIVGGSGSYSAVNWTWGDGDRSTGNPANHTFASSVTGPLLIRATVTDSDSATANGSALVRILAPPAVNLTVSSLPSPVPPVSVNFTLVVTGGSGNYSDAPLWSFGDGTTTRGLSPLNHTFDRAGHFEVTVATNDSLGGTAQGAVWVNISGGAASGDGGGTAPVWTFTGVDNPNQAALSLMGVVAVSGLGLLYRRRIADLRKRSPSGPAATPAGRSTATPAPPGRAGARR